METNLKSLFVFPFLTLYHGQWSYHSSCISRFTTVSAPLKYWSFILYPGEAHLVRITALRVYQNQSPRWASTKRGFTSMPILHCSALSCSQSLTCSLAERQVTKPLHKKLYEAFCVQAPLTLSSEQGQALKPQTAEVSRLFSLSATLIQTPLKSRLKISFPASLLSCSLLHINSDLLSGPT